MTSSFPYRLAMALILAPILSSCSYAGPPPNPTAPQGQAPEPLSPANVAPLGMYVDLQTSPSRAEILGYRSKSGRPRPYCKVSGVSFADRVGVDAAGDLMVPDSFAGSITVFRGPRMCGRKLGSFKDHYGQPLDVASDDAATGRVAVANIFDNSGNGSISVCTLAHGCTSNLRNTNMVQVAGVAMANNGDCWASAVNSSSMSTLTFFKHCGGTGQLSSGYRNKAYGGLDIDTHGNILSISWSGYGSELYVYQGCNPRCTLIGGPFKLKLQTMTGHLNKDGTTFATAVYQHGRIDIYKYTPTAVTYEYSFTDGLSGGTTAGVAFTPRSKE
ncbi:MAG TPA: hypothetical protein VIW73_13775 [Candidatus Cybelea sp.]